jgi:hypothetical protein
MFKTYNEGGAYEHSLDHALEFFSKAGSLFEKRKSHYGSGPQKIISWLSNFPHGQSNEDSALSLFQKTWIVDKEISFKLLLWLRDCRGGAGNRSGFRSCISWLAKREPDWINLNIKQLPAVGRWDDLTALYDTPCEEAALKLWAAAIKLSDNLACKWADRRDNKLRKFMNLSPKEYRKLLVKGTKVVENKMCSNQWNQVEYKSVPSLAMARYTNAFGKHDNDRLEEFKKNVQEGKEKINASVLFPHDCIRTALEGDDEIANLQFSALPNYLSENNKRILCLCDTSGSMSTNVSGSVQAIYVSMGLSLYCSDRLAKDNPFYRKFIQFESEAELTDWTGKNFSDVVTGKTPLFDGACGSTNIQKALETILSFAQMFKVSKEQMPNTIIIVSDMQFDQGVTDPNKTEIETAIGKWAKAGYDVPTIIFWNTAGYIGSPATVDINNVALVSGFSPSILSAIFSGDDISPGAVMIRALEKYEVIKPDLKV